MKIPKNPKILISRGDVLGDVVVTTTVLKPLKKAFPSSNISYLINPVFEPLLKPHPDITECLADELPYTITLKDWPAIFKLAMAIRKKKYDLFIGLWEHPVYGWLAKLAGIPIRIGHRQSLSNRLTYTHTVKQDFTDFFTHKVESNSELLMPLGISDAATYPVDLVVDTDKETTLKEKYPWLSQPFCVVHLDANNPQRILPDDQQMNIVRYLITLSETVILTGRIQNQATANLIKKQCPAVIDCTTKLSLDEWAIVIKQAKLLISSDTGAVHIATGFQTPVLVYYFNRIQNAFEWGPWKTRHAIVKSHHDCTDRCQPSVCRKPDCREGTKMTDFQAAINTLLAPKPDPTQTEKSIWAQATLSIAIFLDPRVKPEDDESVVSSFPRRRESSSPHSSFPRRRESSLENYLKNQKIPTLPISLNTPLKTLAKTCIDQNLNIIVLPETPLSLRQKLKLKCLKIILANNLTFVPKTLSPRSAFEFEMMIT